VLLGGSLLSVLAVTAAQAAGNYPDLKVEATGEGGAVVVYDVLSLDPPFVVRGGNLNDPLMQARRAVPAAAGPAPGGHSYGEGSVGRSEGRVR
jgi:hypothetical protein